ncbi:MAG: tetratricopeptide repeat protein [Vampirovibrionales bacterium]|nr:tetratricopeptide repeat protein [Vampirovibrionales bacterium]
MEQSVSGMVTKNGVSFISGISSDSGVSQLPELMASFIAPTQPSNTLAEWWEEAPALVSQGVDCPETLVMTGWAAYFMGQPQQAEWALKQYQYQFGVHHSASYPSAQALQGVLAERRGNSEEAWQHLASALPNVGHDGLKYAVILGQARLVACRWGQETSLRHQATWLGRAVALLPKWVVTQWGQWIAPQSQVPQQPSFMGLVQYVFQTVRHAQRLDSSAESRQQFLDRLHQLHQWFPGSGLLMDALGVLYQQQYNVDQAVYWFRKSLYRKPFNASGWARLGHLLESLGQASEATQCYDRCLSIMPNHVEALCARAGIYWLAGESQPAMALYRQALQHVENPREEGMLAATLAECYEQVNPQSDAIEPLYETAVARCPDDVGYAVRLGVRWYAQNKLAESEQLYRNTLAYHPGNALLLCSIGYLRWMQNDQDDAMTCYRMAIESDASYDVPYNNLGVIYLDEMGDWDMAEKLFEKAIDRNPEYAMAYYNMGRVHRLQGNMLEAAVCFQWAKELSDASFENVGTNLEGELHQLFQTQPAA